MAKSRAELIAENRALRATNRSRDVASVVNNTIRFGCLAAFGYWGHLSILALAGKKTTASFSMLANINVSIAIAWTVALTGAGWGYYQQKLRQDTIERMSDRIRELEEQIDENRSSSKLTRRGRTRPEDK